MADRMHDLYKRGVFVLTELKELTKDQLAEKYEQSESLYRAILSTISDAVFITDFEGRFKFICPNTKFIFGYSDVEFEAFATAGNILGKDILDLKELNKRGELKNIEHVIVDKHGNQHLLLINIKKAEVLDGSVLYTCRDITHSRLAEKALAESETRLEKLVQNINTGVMQITPEMRIISVNNMMLKWFPDVEFYNNPICYEVLNEAPCLSPCNACPAVKSLIDGAQHELLDRRVLEGKSRDYRITSVPIPGERGEITSIYVILKDITEQRELERDVLNIHEMERIRIGHVLHDDLGQHLVGMEYAALALSDVLKERDVDDNGLAGKICRNARYAIEATKKLIKGLYPVEFGENSLQEALASLCAEIENLFGIQCSFEYSMIDSVIDNTLATNLFHIAQEAVNNAVKHGKPGIITIRLKEDSGAVTLLIEDDGTGFSDDRVSRNGLGLKIMKYRAGLMDGVLDVSRNRERGTSVRCLIKKIKGITNEDKEKNFYC